MSDLKQRARALRTCILGLLAFSLWWSAEAKRPGPMVSRIDERGLVSWQPAPNTRSDPQGFLVDQVEAFEASEKSLTTRLLLRSGGQPRPLSLREIQNEVLDPSTLLLEYSLGETRSFLWVVSPGSIHTYVLPPRSEIETAAIRVHELLARGYARATKVQLEVELIRLSDMLLKPAAAHLDAETLAIVPDGALHLIPFAALPDPRSRPEEREPLVSGYQIVNLPSASTLPLLRDRAGRRAAPRQLAVLADPVFSPEDPRVSQPGPSTLQPFPRLPFSEKEAEAILSLVPRQNRLAALGFAANRRAVLDGLLDNYRFIHFATHGLTSGPLKDSGLVLSSIDENGKIQEPILRDSEVSQLNLAADLVVLSACGTQSSEGMTALARSFLDAGASRVLVSSWSVSDRATARFMTYFYRKLLVEKHSPAAALRKAQESMRAEPSWASPYYWASFAIQGDWRWETVP